MGSLLRETGEITQKEILDILRNPSLQNSQRLRDLILSNLRRVNNLKENDPEFLELVSQLYGNDLTKQNLNQKEELSKIAKKIEDEGIFSQEESKIVDLKNVKPLNPPDFLNFNNSNNSQILNETLLTLVTENDLSELGITSSFVNALEDFCKYQKKKNDKERNSLIEYQGLQKKLIFEEDEIEIGQYSQWNTSLINRKDKNNLLAEQLAINEVNLVGYQKYDKLVEKKEIYEKKKIYRVDGTGQIKVYEENLLSNGSIFNQDEKKDVIDVEQEYTLK